MSLYLYNQDNKYKENIANNYNSYIINDLLRQKYKYDGVVCTEWLVTADETAIDVFLLGKSWVMKNYQWLSDTIKSLWQG